MNNWVPYDYTGNAQELVRKYPSNSNIDNVTKMDISRCKRVPLFDGKLSQSKSKVLEINKFSINHEQVDLT